MNKALWDKMNDPHTEEMEALLDCMRLKKEIDLLEQAIKNKKIEVEPVLLMNPIHKPVVMSCLNAMNARAYIVFSEAVDEDKILQVTTLIDHAKQNLVPIGAPYVTFNTTE